MMNALGTPFSCPICFEDYDGVEFNPATLICGHSCCITHVDLLNKKCYNCRQPFDPKSTHISYALRDGSILYTTMKDRMNGLRLASKPINIDIPIIPIANAPTTANLKSDIKSDADRPPPAPSAPSATRLTTSTQQQLMHYKMTSNINSSGNKVRSGPSFDNEQIASIEWRKFNNDTILIDEVIQVSNGAMWGRLSPSHYPVLRSTYNFKVHDPEQAWVIISTPTKTNYFTLVTPSTLTGLTPTSPVRIKNRYKLTSEVPRGGLRVRKTPGMSGTQVGSVEWRKFEYNIITIIEEIDVGDGGRWGRLDSCHYNIISDSYKFEPYAPGTEGWVSILWPPDKSILLAVCDRSADADADADVRMSGASAGGASVGAVASATAVSVGAAPPPTNTNSNSSSDANANANRTYFQALESNAVQDLLAQEQARIITITRQVEEDEELARQLAEQWNLADADGDGDAGANQREGEGEDEDEDGDEDEDIAPLSPAVPPALSRANSGNGWVVLQPSPRGEDGASSLPRQPRQPEQDSYMGFVKTCGHRCTLSYVDKCCSCMDMRPIPIPVIAEAEADPERMAEAERMAERMYPRYSDGMGWINNGGRTDGYCPICKQ